MRGIIVRSFGLEIEVTNNNCKQERLTELIKIYSHKKVSVNDGWQQTINNDYWHVKTDSSCGWEIASFVGNSFQDLRHISRVVEQLAINNVAINNSCGFHIHANVSDLTTKQVGLVHAKWLKIEDFLLQAVPSHRINNTYCMPLKKCFMIKYKKGFPYNMENFWDEIKPTKLHVHSNEQKRVTLNAVNYATSVAHAEANGVPDKSQRPTLEFRLPEGTLDPDDIKYWTVFFINFIDYTSQKSVFPKTFNSLSTLKKFFIYVGLGKKEIEKNEILLNAKMWFLKRFNLYGNDKIKSEIKELCY